MRNIWKTIGVVVLVVMILGAICVGIGLATGADSSRIYSTVDNKYSVSATLQQRQDQINKIIENIQSAFNG